MLPNAGQTHTPARPNCPGVITPDEIKIGIMPGTSTGRAASASCRAPARSRMKRSGSHRARARPVDRMGIGGDPVNGLKHLDILKLFNDDPGTDATS